MRRRGFSLVELLVVISIIAVLVALLLPAVQAAREASRAAQCKNNLKQVGLALQAYHSARNALPMSATVGPGRGNGHSFLTMVLPQMEAQPLYNAYNFRVEPFDPANSTAVGTELATLLCPSSPLLGRRPASQVVTIAAPGSYPGTSAFARNHYAANWGGGRPAPHADARADYAATRKAFRGVMMTVRALTPAGVETRCLRIDQIPDGSSTTLALGEKRDGSGWAVGGFGGSEFDVWTGPAYDGTAPALHAVYTGSNHPGVAHFGFADGSVRPLKASTAKAVWYALTTRDGREALGADSY